MVVVRDHVAAVINFNELTILTSSLLVGARRTQHGLGEEMSEIYIVG